MTKQKGTAKKAKPKRRKIAGLVAIDQYLQKCGLTRKWLAKKLGLTEQALANWWIRNSIPIEQVEKIVEATGLDAGALFPDLAAVFRKGWRIDADVVQARSQRG